MTKYRIRYVVTYYAYVEVTADSTKEAEETAWEEIHTSGAIPPDADIELDEITEVPDEEVAG